MGWQLAQELLVARADDAWGTGLEERPSYVVVAATAGIGIQPTVRQKKVDMPTRLVSCQIVAWLAGHCLSDGCCLGQIYRHHDCHRSQVPLPRSPPEPFFRG